MQVYIPYLRGNRRPHFRFSKMATSYTILTFIYPQNTKPPIRYGLSVSRRGETPPYTNHNELVVVFVVECLIRSD